MGKILNDFNKTKIASDTVKKGSIGQIGQSTRGNSNKTNIPFKSGTKAATPPTSL